MILRWNSLGKAVLIRDHNMHLNGEIRRSIPKLSSNIRFMISPVFDDDFGMNSYLKHSLDKSGFVNNFVEIFLHENIYCASL